jgi:hypothetical protein
MTKQSNYMLSGLERELELYMGAEYESGDDSLTIAATVLNKWEMSVPGVTASLPAPAETRVNIKFEVDKSTQSGIITVVKSDDNTVLETRELKKLKANKEGTAVTGIHINIVSVTLTIENTTLKVSGKAFFKKVKEDSYSTTLDEVRKLVEFIKLNLPASEQEYFDEYEPDPGEDSAGTEHFDPFSFFKKKEDPTAELIEFLNITDRRTREQYITKLREKILHWIEVSNQRSLSTVALQKARQLLELALLPTSSGNTTDRVKEALVVLGSLKEIAIAGAIIDVISGLALPLGPISLLLKVGISAAKIGQTVLITARVVQGLRTVQGILEVSAKINDAAGAAKRVKQAQSEIQQIEGLALQESYGNNELELDEFEFENEFEYEEVFAGGIEYEDEFEQEYELENELNELEDDSVTEGFASRLYELSNQSFESEFELEMELDRALDAVEDEFMVKRLHRKKKKGKHKGLFKKILSTGAKVVGKIASKTPIGSLIKAGTSLVRGDVKGALGGLAKAAVGTVLGPVAGTVATTAIDALSGSKEGEISRGERKRRAIRKVARIARDTYREVADTLPEDFDHPLIANEVARKAVRKAMIKNDVKPPLKTGATAGDRRIIRLQPGEQVVIIRS